MRAGIASRDCVPAVSPDTSRGRRAPRQRQAFRRPRETPLKDALEVAERIRAAVAGSPFELDSGRVACTVSIGAAAFPEDGGTLDAVVARADRAMYQAKQQGRNRVLRYQPA